MNEPIIQQPIEQRPIVKQLVEPVRFGGAAHEYKVVALRECPSPPETLLCDTPERAAEYWRTSIESEPRFLPEQECLAVLLLNTRKKIKGHNIIAIGSRDTICIYPTEVFRLAVIASAAAIIMMHNHPSGDPTPSEADIRVTREMRRAGQLLKIELLDHVIMGHASLKHVSLRELGYFC